MIEPITTSATNIKTIKQFGDLARQIYNDKKLIIPSDVEIQSKLPTQDIISAREVYADKGISMKDKLIVWDDNVKLNGSVMYTTIDSIKSSHVKDAMIKNSCHHHHKNKYVRIHSSGHIRAHHDFSTEYNDFKFEQIS